MEEIYIGFETAKLAKEKGIDLPHTHYYIYPFRSFKATGELKQNATNNDQNHNLRQVVNTRKMQPHMAPAYSQSALQKWLREEHRIHVWVGSPTDGFYEACVFRDKTNYYRKFDDFTTNETDFTTYESALEDGLFEALKLIK